MKQQTSSWVLRFNALSFPLPLQSLQVNWMSVNTQTWIQLPLPRLLGFVFRLLYKAHWKQCCCSLYIMKYQSVNQFELEGISKRFVRSEKEPTGSTEQARCNSGQEKLPCGKKPRADPYETNRNLFMGRKTKLPSLYCEWMLLLMQLWAVYWAWTNTKIINLAILYTLDL